MISGSEVPRGQAAFSPLMIDLDRAFLEELGHLDQLPECCQWTVFIENGQCGIQSGALAILLSA
jgi:hypothetical protein